MSSINKGLSALRAEMSKLNIDAWYISGTDPHASEYLPDRWQTRSFISGFTGSYGMLIVTANESALWTDTRYFIQAREQLEGTEIKMEKLRVADAVPPEIWLSKKLKPGSKVGIDPQTISISSFLSVQQTLAKKDIEFVQTNDLFENIWPDRPEISKEKVFELDIRYSGQTRTEKQHLIADKLKEQGSDYHVITMLDELAWTYNLRGADVNFNPVFTGFALISEKESHLFVDKKKVSQGLLERLQKDNIQLHAYNDFFSFLNSIEDKKIFIDKSTANYSVLSTLQKSNECIFGTSIVAKLKSRKNNVEIEGFKKAMVKDGVALTKFHYWLKQNIGVNTISEFQVGQKLKEFRTEQENFVDESFPPIVGYKEHGAIVHLSVGEDNALDLKAEGIILFDSGAQYFEGTTDITRTVALGKVTQQQKEDYTLVLKGVISLTEAVFPYGTKGCHLDILARKALWEKKMNYGHGTGHGVGHFLNVHEGPMAIRQEYNENSIEPGMVMSNEPAFYREGQYGIRTENMMLCVEKESSEYGRFLGFQTLTLCPIDTTLIDVRLLNDNEKDWINNYHKEVYSALKPHLSEEYCAFLKELTKAI